MITPADIRNLNSKDAVNRFFRSELCYQVDPVSFDAGELEIPDGPAQHIHEVEQLCNYQRQFQVYFMHVDSLRRTDIRGILDPFCRKHPGNYLFVFTEDYDELALVSPLRMLTGDDTTKTRLNLRTLLVDRSNVYHTDLETLERIRLSPGEAVASVIWEKHREAFNVERVTKDFFRRYHDVFDDVEWSIKGIPDAEDRHLFTQTLLNRLMFCWFLQKKDWLNHEQDYLARRLKKAEAQGKNFYSGVLYFLFFWAMNNPNEHSWWGKEERMFRQLIGEVPFLNGGLFEMEEWDNKAQIPNDVFDDIFDRLFGRYNFTVEESTPLDIRVAVDPEILGRVFEELVIERHQRGSYYTPRDVVSFMCRESLKAYLTERLTGKDDAIATLVDDHEVSGLSIADAKKIATALDEVRVCDPACGSGAYLLGMLHELVALSTLIYNRDLQLEPKSLYQHKLNIIQNNLYGVDIDTFAVNIAMLRIWLSLAVDHNVDDIKDVQPLPNLDFKIEVGDSLTAPDPSGGEQPEFRYKDILDFSRLKSKYLMAYGEKKSHLRRQIEELRSRIAKWAHLGEHRNGFDWAVEFAEVFAPRQSSLVTLTGSMADVINRVPGQMEFTSDQRMGGFDIVLANPPYVRADERPELLPYREKLKNSGIYETLYEKWDLYVAFLERGYQLLRPGGVLNYIISDSYTAAKYAKKSQEFFIKNAVIRRIDFVHDIQIFDAGVRNIMLCIKRQQNQGHEPLRVYHSEEFGNIVILPSASQSELGIVLFRPDGERPMELPENSVPLEMICYVSVGMVIHCDEKKAKGLFRAEDVVSDTKDAQHPKPYVEGKDIVKWCIRRVRYLEYGTMRAPAMYRRPTFVELHNAKERLLASRMCAETPAAVYDNQQLFSNHTVIVFVPWKYLKGVVNKSISKTAKYMGKGGDRERREQLSQQFHPKYLLAVMNSMVARDFLNTRRRHKLDIYPDDWKVLPIPSLPMPDQLGFVGLVDKILFEFEQWGYPLPRIAVQHVAELEAELDERVAALYAGNT